MNDVKDKHDRKTSAAPDAAKAPGQKQDAGHDESIEERLQRRPDSREARLDRALDESMDASDPPASTQPIHSHEPPKSSGYSEEEEKARQEDA